MVNVGKYTSPMDPMGCGSKCYGNKKWILEVDPIEIVELQRLTTIFSRIFKKYQTKGRPL